MLLFMDGFDHSGTVAASHWTKYATQSPTGQTLNGSVVSSPTRTGIGAASLGYLGNGFGRNVYTIPSGTLLIAGLAFRTGGIPSSNRALLGFQEGATNHIGIGMTPAGTLFVWMGSTSTVLQTGATVLAANSWYYVEFKAVINDTTGSYELRIDGISELVANGVDTKNGATGVATGFWVYSAGDPSWAWYIDDLYFCDGTGLSRNDFLGAIKIETLLAQSGNGSNVGLTPSFSTDHGALVDEVPPNTADYNSGVTVGVKDTYNLPSVTLTGGILGVQVNLFVAKSDAGLRKVAAVVRTSGLDYDGVDKPLSTTFSYATEVWAQKPGGAPVDWSVVDVNALEAGMKVTV